MPLWLATLAILAGRWADGRELGTGALELGRQADDPNAPLFVGIQRRMWLFVQWRHAEIPREVMEERAAASPAATGGLPYLARHDAERGPPRTPPRRRGERACRRGAARRHGPRGARQGPAGARGAAADVVREAAGRAEGLDMPMLAGAAGRLRAGATG